MNNTFYPSLEMISNRFDNLSNDTLYKTFGSPYIVCLKDNAEFKSYFYEQILDKEQAQILKDSITIIPSTYKIVSGLSKRFLTVVNKQFLTSFDIYDKYDQPKIHQNEEALLCVLLRFKYSNILRYLKQFDGICSFIDLYNSLIISDFLGQYNGTSTVRKNHIQIISNMNESNYYTIHNNCQLNITLKFRSRGFNLSLSRKLLDENMRSILEKMAEINENENYLAMLLRKTSYLDASSAVNISGYKLYKISNNLLVNSLKKNDFNMVYDRLSYTEKYHFIMNCLISKDLCHLIVNNSYILNEIMNVKDQDGKTFIEKYCNLIRYYLGYAWITMYMEESIKRGYINNDDRFIFDIDTASLLPFYPYYVNNIHFCPYLPVLVDQNTLSINKNILGVSQIYYETENPRLKEISRYGIADKGTFINRINSFATGLNYVNIFENIDWSNIAIGGSIMACCLPNFNPLMHRFIYDNQDDINFAQYASTYYSDADIDVMCNIQDKYLFVDKIVQFKDQIDRNLKRIHNIVSDIQVTNLISNKTMAIMINIEYINKYILPVVNMDLTKVLLKLNDDPVIKGIIYEQYLEWHKNFLKSEIESNMSKFIDSKYHELFDILKPEQINIVFVKTNQDRDKEFKDQSLDSIKAINSPLDENIIDDDDKEFEEDTRKDKENDKDNENEPENEPDDGYNPPDNILFLPKLNYKFRISSPYLPHPFEIFQTKYTEFFATVSRFHLPIVRSYYDGNTVYITPSCITACMTFLNMDYKYFAGSKDPIEIINKYRSRGFGTILNENEIKRLLEYSSVVPKWKVKYDLNLKSQASVNGVLGLQTVASKLFSDSATDNNIHRIIYRTINNSNQNSTDALVSYNAYINYRYNIKRSELFDIHTLTFINKYGFIEPIKKWLIDACYDNSFYRNT
jgi:hypothetical protein